MQKHEYLEDELLIVANSGEIPEVAYHGSLYFLTEDPEGPRLTLEEEEVRPLKEAVFNRYRKILLRDCNPTLRDKSVYRGLARCAVNWRRFRNFCHRENFCSDEVRQQVAGALVAFLRQEISDVRAGHRCSSVNCTASELAEFAGQLGISPAELPAGWQALCR